MAAGIVWESRGDLRRKRDFETRVRADDLRRVHSGARAGSKYGRADHVSAPNGRAGSQTA